MARIGQLNAALKAFALLFAPDSHNAAIRSTSASVTGRRYARRAESAQKDSRRFYAVASVGCVSEKQCARCDSGSSASPNRPFNFKILDE